MANDFWVIGPTEDAGLAGFVPAQPPAVKYRFIELGRIDAGWRLPFGWSHRGDADLPDWLGTVHDIRLVSRRFREVVEPLLGEGDEIEWIDAPFTGFDGVEHEYFIPHFASTFDMYDETYTDWGPSGLPIRWVLSRAKLDRHALFAPFGVGVVMIARDDVATAMKNAGLRGIAYRPPRIE